MGKTYLYSALLFQLLLYLFFPGSSFLPSPHNLNFLLKQCPERLHSSYAIIFTCRLMVLNCFIWYFLHFKNPNPHTTGKSKICTTFPSLCSSPLASMGQSCFQAVISNVILHIFDIILQIFHFNFYVTVTHQEIFQIIFYCFGSQRYLLIAIK